jgi:hypothetical protein
VLALAAAGLGMVTPAAGATTPQATAESDPALVATEQLLAYVPSDARATCARRDPSSFSSGSYQAAMAVVDCASPTDGVDEVIYALYPQSATLTHDYGSIVPTGLAPMTVSDGCTGAGDWNYKDQTSGGHDACFTITPEGHDPIGEMAWTGEASHILGLAVSTTDNGSALKEWWNKSAGPLEQPDVVKFASIVARDRKAAGKALVKQTSRAVSKCKLRDGVWTLYTPDDAEWAWLPWLSAEELCNVPGGVVYYAQVQPDAAYGFWAAFREHLTDTGYPSTKHPAVCKTPRDLLNVQNQAVGQVHCWYFHTTLWASWYNRETGVVGAVSVATTPQKIYGYLNQHKLQ